MKTIASANKTQLTVRRIAISALFAALIFCGTYLSKYPCPLLRAIYTRATALSFSPP